MIGIKLQVHAAVPVRIPKPKTKPPFSLKQLITKKKSESSTPETKCILEFDPQEIARQLTLIEYQLFASINTREFLDLSWMKKDKNDKSPTIIQFTKWSSHVSFWVVTEIVQLKTAKQRAQAMETFINVAHASCFID